MDGYTWTFSDFSINIFHNGELWGVVQSTADEKVPSTSSLEKLKDMLPDDVLDALLKDAQQQRDKVSTG